MRKTVESLANTVDQLGLFRGLEMLDTRPNRLRVLTYHRVAHPQEFPQLEPGLISATPQEFHQQMKVLAERYNPVCLDEVLHAQLGKSTLPPRAVLVTFDDGYIDFETNAWPILQRYAIPCVLFVPTEFPDGHTQGFWWDRLHHAITNTQVERFQAPDATFVEVDPAAPRAAYKVARAIVKSMEHRRAMDWVEETIANLGGEATQSHVISWPGLRNLVSQGVTICSHGKRHAIMTQLDSQTLNDDLETSLQRVTDELPDQQTLPVIAYPSGYVNRAVVQATQIHYQFGFGGRRGVQSLPCQNSNECFTLARLPVQGYQHGLFRAFLRPGISALGNKFFRVRERYAA